MASQTSVANIATKATYKNTDYLIVDDLTTTNKMQLGVIESGISETVKTEALEYVKEHYSSDITENTVFNINGVTFKLTATEV